MLRDTGENFVADVSAECFGQEIANGGEGGGHERENFVDQGIGFAEAGLFGDGGSVAGADDGLLDLSVGQRRGGDFFRPGRRFALGQRVPGAHATAADGGEGVEGGAGVSAEAALETLANGCAVGRRGSKEAGIHPIA